ncbi:hypothetical protein [Oceanospirillum maris]|uniref:hypothetical protein n=1 Tax=Oceanospirillum maris TaxID=64977 RepID=UPI0004036889|nr:hypothetical protein [Oceanospirillum maris]
MSSHLRAYSNYQKRVIKGVADLVGDLPFTYEKSSNNHLQIKIKGVDRVFFTSSTPSDRRSYENIMSDIRGELKRIEVEEQPTPVDESLPESAEKSAARQALQEMMDKSVRTIIKKHRNSIDKIKKDEFQAFLAADFDSEGDVVREFRKNLIKSEIERVLKSRTNNEFIPPGMINKSKKQIEENLNFMLPSMAHYQSLGRDQAPAEHSDLEPLEHSSLEPASTISAKDKVDDSAVEDLSSDDLTGSNRSSSGVVSLDHVSHSVVKDSVAKNTVAKNVAEVIAESKDFLPQLLDEKPHKRLAAIKALSKKQIALLIEDCQKALEQKHQEDIRDLAHQIQAKGISIEELEAALSR